MAAAVAAGSESPIYNGTQPSMAGLSDPFVESGHLAPAPPAQRYSALYDPDSVSLGTAHSPAQVKRSIQAHLLETERRLEETGRLGEALLQQERELKQKLSEVETQQGDAEISPELRRRLADLEKEHDDVGKEIARALIGPKSRAVSGEEKNGPEPSTFSSLATASPTKVTAPNRRQRNQPTDRAGDLQFAADISTSLLAQVRQLQSAVAERDQLLKETKAERDQLEQEAKVTTQRLRSLDESEQRYKDENWNLETQTHELLAAAREAADREKRLSASLAATMAEKTRVQNEMDEIRLAHGKLADDHATAKKAHDTEVHTLKRTIDVVEGERGSLHSKIEELTSQNHELARAMATKIRGQHAGDETFSGQDQDDQFQQLSSPEGSPPPSPTKGTPRHGGLESETLRSSLHHAHRMIQNLKNNIHREKTEKIELKRMLQDARDELERSRDGLGSGSKRQKTKSDIFKKPPRPDILGGSRRSRTEIEMEDEDWEDHVADTPTHSRFLIAPSHTADGRITDQSDAYQTANDTEGNFETADELHATESEAFQTGAESLAGDSTDDLTETEDTASQIKRIKVSKATLASKAAGDRRSYMSTASTSAGEDDDIKPHIMNPSQKFRLRNERSSLARQSRFPSAGTPTNLYSERSLQDSPATSLGDRSPLPAEQSLYAELGDFDEASNFDTPGRMTSVASVNSTPATVAAVAPSTPGLRTGTQSVERSVVKAAMVDAGTMTEETQVAPDTPTNFVGSHSGLEPSPIFVESDAPSRFPLPPSVPSSPAKHMDNATQYTPQRLIHDSPIRGPAFITPPKMAWDDAQSPTAEGSQTPRNFDYSELLVQTTAPVSPEQSVKPVAQAPQVLSYSAIESQSVTPVQPQVIDLLEKGTAMTPKKAVSHREISTMMTPERPIITNEMATAMTPEKPILTNEMATAMTPEKPIVTSETATAMTPTSTRDMPTAMTPVAQREFSSGTTQTHDSPSRPHTAEKVVAGGILATAAAALGLASSTGHSGSATSEDSTSIPTTFGPGNFSGEDKPSDHVSGDSRLSRTPVKVDQQHDLPTNQPVTFLSNDQASQTLLTAAEIERALSPAIIQPLALADETSGSATNSTSIVPETNQAPKSIEVSTTQTDSLPSPVIVTSSPTKRPSSSSSQRLSSLTGNHPPLPPDHREAIARAESQVGSPTRESPVAKKVVMGPPALPASAMRRPRTPGESLHSPTGDSNFPRTSNVSRSQQGTVVSQMSHRSSISSFASEVDGRFATVGTISSNPYGSATSTDPRMIQAITQTMIGEYLWKYTRKAGRQGFSESRHRRYFWVHPYTKMLFWSDVGPHEGGKSNKISKSVEIQGIRIINDDNPMPPGLHRKSLEIQTPGRKIRITAQTGQRHETWFSALNYLLLRGDPDTVAAYAPNGQAITNDDVNEFNVHGAGYGATLTPVGDRVSLSSYNSRTTRNSSHRGSTMARVLDPAASGAASSRAQDSTVHRGFPPSAYRTGRAEKSDEKDRTLRANSASRFSRMMGSMTGRARNEQSIAKSDGGSIYDASVVSDGRRDSAEEMRKDMLRQEQEGLGGGLENVRACCDGKHDVSTLSHAHRHAAPGSHSHRASGIRGTINSTIRRSNVNVGTGASNSTVPPSPSKATS